MNQPTTAPDERPLHTMYETVPRRYDFLNRLMTLGFDQHWRRVATREALAGKPARLLDLCTGTGDLAIMIRKAAPGEMELEALDFSFPMLSAARHKALRAGTRNIRFTEGDAGQMPYPDGYFDCLTIGFGFRNLTFENPNRDRNVKEIFRVLAPGGKLVIAETSQPSGKLWKAFIGWVSRRVLPVLGGLFSGQWGAYRYLGESSARFFSPAELKGFLESYGFWLDRQRLFFGGVAGVFVFGRQPVASNGIATPESSFSAEGHAAKG